MTTSLSPFDLGGLLIGTATSSLQIEGGHRANSWYDWASLSGTIVDGSSPVRATDHWERWREDTALMSGLGLPVHRLGIEWARIEPRPGEVDDDAIERYRAELQALRDAGIRPLVTLHHFGNPSWFQGLGEWTSPHAPEIWLRFVDLAVRRLGDLVDEWVTINEPNVYATQAHLFGEAPPGRRSAWLSCRAVLRHLAIAHVRAYRLIHELQPHATVCFAHHARVFEPLDRRNPLHRGVARLDAALFQEVIADAMLGGRWHPLLGRRPADIAPGRHHDVIGLNYCSRSAVSGLADGTHPGAPTNDLGWEIHPEGIATTARWLHERHPAPIWVTENGTCDNGDPQTAELESFRPRFVLEHLEAMARSGLPFERYYHWCFVDNWEWREGESARFGIVRCDYETQERTLKPSAHLLARLAAEGRVSAETIATYAAGQRYRGAGGGEPRRG